METYALIKAEYGFAEGKSKMNIKILGIDYTQNVFNRIIYFEKEEGYYQLKYYSSTRGERIGINRKLSLIKKQKRFLWDKKLNELKVKLNMVLTDESSTELLIIDNRKLSLKEYSAFNQEQVFPIDFVKKFSDDLWKNYTIIEPSKQMRDYKKIE
jgi:hypothetical protein